MLRLFLLVPVLWLSLAPCPVQADSRLPLRPRSPRLTLGIDTPSEGAFLGGSPGLALLSGRALALAPGLTSLDLILVLDTSDSTDEPFDGPEPPAPKVWWKPGSWLPTGLIFGPGRRLEGSILEAEVRFASDLVERLDPRTTRVGLVVFAGDWDRRAPDARVEIPLTHDLPRVRRILAKVLRRGPFGSTNLRAGVNRALSELLATASAIEGSRAEARRAIVILTDGTGLLPFEENPLTGLSEITRRVRRAAGEGVRIDSVVFGEEAARHSPSLLQIANATQGSFKAIPGKAEENAALAALDFTQIRDVRVRNATLGEDSPEVLRTPDGGFACLVPLEAGLNRIEVSARAAGGASISRSLEVRYRRDADSQPLPTHLLPIRTRLLESYLTSLYERRISLEEEPGSRSVELRVAPASSPAEESLPVPAALDSSD